MKNSIINESDICTLDSENLAKFHNYLLNHSLYNCSDSNNKNSANKPYQILGRKKRTVFSKPVLQKLISIFNVNHFPKSKISV